MLINKKSNSHLADEGDGGERWNTFVSLILVPHLKIALWDVIDGTPYHSVS